MRDDVRRHLTRMTGLALALMSALMPPAAAQESEKDERLREMQEIAEAVSVVAVGESGRTKLELIEGARFRYNQPDIGCDDATVWAWGTGGRPVALLTIAGSWPAGGRDGGWSYELTSLSPERLIANSREGWAWTPQEAGLDFQPFSDAPDPAGSPATRLRQMKELARRFTAYGLYDADDRRAELRVLPTPLHRYDDAEAGIRDGAMFVIAGGTNPEALLAVELVAAEGEAATWRFALNRVSSGKIHAQLDGRDVWSATSKDGHDELSPYFLFFRPMDAAPAR